MTQEQETLRGFNETGRIAYDSKLEVETQRYKQDCRKRALDLAMQNSGISNPEPKDVMKAADDYYKWLIEIPNNGV